MQSKVIGRWFILVKDNAVKIYDTNYTSTIWETEYNQKGYQPTPASYNVDTFMQHDGKLKLWAEVEEWTMSAEEVMNAQAFVATL